MKKGTTSPLLARADAWWSSGLEPVTRHQAYRPRQGEHKSQKHTGVRDAPRSIAGWLFHAIRYAVICGRSCKVRSGRSCVGHSSTGRAMAGGWRPARSQPLRAAAAGMPRMVMVR